VNEYEAARIVIAHPGARTVKEETTPSPNTQPDTSPALPKAA
jgi:hypothetical protein